jgi:hypothetical protein
MSRRMALSSRRSLTLLCMTLLVLGFLPPGQALAYGPITRMFDWNAAGAISGYGANDPNWLRNTIYQSILSRGANYPGIVTLQEVCRRQADELQPFMTSLGFGWFGMYHARETTSTCPGETSAGNVGKTRFGNAVWVWGGGPTWASSPLPPPSQRNRRAARHDLPRPNCVRHARLLGASRERQRATG